jgi:hypothetical protein
VTTDLIEVVTEVALEAIPLAERLVGVHIGLGGYNGGLIVPASSPVGVAS